MPNVLAKEQIDLLIYYLCDPFLTHEEALKMIRKASRSKRDEEKQSRLPNRSCDDQRVSLSTPVQSALLD